MGLVSRFRRRILPAGRRPPFDRGERVLAWAMVADGQSPSPSPSPSPSGSVSRGSVVVATNLGLWVGGVRTPWSGISKAVWDGSVLAVTPSAVVAERDGYSVIEDLPPVRLLLDAPNHLPHQVRMRVTGSVRQSEHHALSRGGVWLAARRVPGVDGLSWVARFDAGTDGSDPAVVAETDVIFAETRWKNVGGSG